MAQALNETATAVIHGQTQIDLALSIFNGEKSSSITT